MIATDCASATSVQICFSPRNAKATTHMSPLHAQPQTIEREMGLFGIRVVPRFVEGHKQVSTCRSWKLASRLRVPFACLERWDPFILLLANCLEFGQARRGDLLPQPTGDKPWRGQQPFSLKSPTKHSVIAWLNFGNRIPTTTRGCGRTRSSSATPSTKSIKLLTSLASVETAFALGSNALRKASLTRCWTKTSLAVPGNSTSRKKRSWKTCCGNIRLGLPRFSRVFVHAPENR